MKPRNTALLVASTVLACAGAYIAVNRASGPDTNSAVPGTETLFPGLTEKANDVASLEVRSKDGTLTFLKQADGWVCKERAGFPAQTDMVRQTIVGLALLKNAEPKTTNTALYSRIGVQDVESSEAAPAADADSGMAATGPTLVTLKDASDATLASAIIGNTKPGQTPAVFVRRVGETQSWLAEGSVPAQGNITLWLKPEILGIPRERIQKVVVTQPDGSQVVASRATAAEPKLSLQNLPEGRELSNEYVVEGLGSAIAYLRLEDVAPVGDIAFDGGENGTSGIPGPTFVAQTFDGLVITIRSASRDGKVWIAAQASVDETVAASHAATEKAAADAKAAAEQAASPPSPAPASEPAPSDDAQSPPSEAAASPAPAADTTVTPPTTEKVHKEADELNASLSKWAYKIAEYSAKTLGTTMDSLLKPLPPPADSGVQGPTAAPDVELPLSPPEPATPSSPE